MLVSPRNLELGKKTKVLVTGGSGFIGRNLTKRLIDDGYEVTITATGTEPILPGVAKILYMGLEGIDWKHVYGQDIVIHQMANNDTRCQDESEIFRANVYGPIKLFTEAAKGGCRKFVYASSTAVYGNEPAPYFEDVTPINPLNKYAVSKAKFDEFAMRFADEANVNVTGLRYCNVYGPGEENKGRRMSMVGQMLRAMYCGKEVMLFEPGDQRRDWVYIKDVVEANILAMTRSSVGRNGNIYNIGSGMSYTFNEVFNTIMEVMKERFLLYTFGKPKYIPCPFSAEYQSHTECNIEKARHDLGYTPSFDLRSGVKEYLEAIIASS
jgi:ADP-L-glycero-D-manno-heptose 6-epimerase